METIVDLKKCEWCGEIIMSEIVWNEFLSGLFGYVYCSKECMDAHIESK